MIEYETFKKPIAILIIVRPLIDLYVFVEIFLHFSLNFLLILAL